MASGIVTFAVGETTRLTVKVALSPLSEVEPLRVLTRKPGTPASLSVLLNTTSCGFKP